MVLSYLTTPEKPALPAFWVLPGLQWGLSSSPGIRRGCCSTGTAIIGCSLLDAVCSLPGPLGDPAVGLPGPDHLLQSCAVSGGAGGQSFLKRVKERTRLPPSWPASPRPGLSRAPHGTEHRAWAHSRHPLSYGGRSERASWWHFSLCAQGWASSEEWASGYRLFHMKLSLSPLYFNKTLLHKTLSDQASSLAPDWILLLWGPRIPVSSRDSTTTFQVQSYQFSRSQMKSNILLFLQVSR